MNTPGVTSRFTIDTLPVTVLSSNEALGEEAARLAAIALRGAATARGEVNWIASTGNSMLSFYASLRAMPDIPWSVMRLFLVDQYLDVDTEAFGTLAFLKKHLLPYVEPMAVYPAPSRSQGIDDACSGYAALLSKFPADLATIGFGENGHIAFNDPHNASFTDGQAVKMVELSAESRMQPVKEGRFPDLTTVPKWAVTVTLPAILAATDVLCIVPEARKATAVRACLLEPISERRPGSVLRTVKHAKLLLDADSASLLEGV